MKKAQKFFLSWNDKILRKKVCLWSEGAAVVTITGQQAYDKVARSVQGAQEDRQCDVRDLHNTENTELYNV